MQLQRLQSPYRTLVLLPKSGQALESAVRSAIGTTKAVHTVSEANIVELVKKFKDDIFGDIVVLLPHDLCEYWEHSSGITLAQWRQADGTDVNFVWELA